MTLHSSQIGGVGAATAASTSAATDTKKSSGTSFSAVFKDATSTATDTKAPSGETTQAVEGHKYADIVAGPRKGLFLNTGSNARAGQAFVLVKKNGREYHIYGTGKDRVVIGMKTKAEKQDATTPPSTTTPTTPSTTADSGPVNTG